MDHKQTLTAFLVIVIGANFLALALYFYGVLEITRGQGNIDAELKKLSQAVSGSFNSKKQAEVLEKTESSREKINHYFIDTKKTARFLEELEDLGKDIGVSVKVESVQVENKATLRVDLVSNGSFKEMYHFLQALHALPYTVEFRAINLSRVNISSKDMKSRGLWGANISLRVVSFSNI